MGLVMEWAFSRIPEEKSTTCVCVLEIENVVLALRAGTGSNVSAKRERKTGAKRAKSNSSNNFENVGIDGHLGPTSSPGNGVDSGATLDRPFDPNYLALHVYMGQLRA